MTSHRIGVNLRVSGNCDQGARKYMEDNHVIKFLKKDTDDYEFAYFGIFDGHGGPEASAFCRDNLLNEITKYDGFWTDDDEQVLAAIRKGFLDTHNAMWNVLDTWPKTLTGLPSTAGSTATIAIVKQGKLYTGHVGDSALVLGENDAYGGDEFPVQAICITKEHKPDDPDERMRIEGAGGEVINKSGVPRVVWSRPKINHKGPVRRSTQIDQIPFLAVARSLGDLWSYDYFTETYVVSPNPDVTVLKLDPIKHRCLILASDGLWNMLTPEEAVNMVIDLETQFEQKIINDPNVAVSFWSNPAERLVSRALNKWRSKALKADNTSCVVVLIDPLGPSKLTLLKRKRQELLSGGEITTHVKIAKLPTEVDHRGKFRNKNANCSLSDSHIRVTDDSIIQPTSERAPLASAGLRRSFNATLKPDLLGTVAEDRYNESINDSVQYIPRPSVGELEKDSDSDFERSLPQPPPSTPQSDIREVDSDGENDGENSLHSSADITDKAFSLASDESIESTGSPFEDDDRPKTLSAPAKLSSSKPRRCNMSKNAKRKIVKSGKKLHNFSRPPVPKAKPKVSLSLLKSPPAAAKSSRVTAEVAPHHKKTATAQMSTDTKNSLAKFVGHISMVTPVKSNTLVKTIETKAIGKQCHLMSPPKSITPPRRVLNTSKSMNDVATPKNQRESMRSVSCTGLTPDLNLLMSEKPKPVINTSAGTCTSKSDITTHLFSSLMAADRADLRAAATYRSHKDSSLIVENSDLPQPSSLKQPEPLKQLNKTGPIRKTGSKRWGNFLRASKMGLDQMFHLGNHRKNSEASTGKFATTSTSKLECGNPKMVSTKNTSLSTSKLGDISLTHLPDITVSHLGDMTVNASTLTAGDLTTLSALSANESMLSAVDLAEAHHSMLDAGLDGKVSKPRKGFLQKTRVTLRRARKAAKKAFFPENHRLFSHKSTGNKRKSDEFLPTPELKRRRQLLADKT